MARPFHRIHIKTEQSALKLGICPNDEIAKRLQFFSTLMDKNPPEVDEAIKQYAKDEAPREEK